MIIMIVIILIPPVSVTRFPSFRTQPLENLSIDSVTDGFLSNPAPGENLVSGNLVMETGCINKNVTIINTNTDNKANDETANDSTN